MTDKSISPPSSQRVRNLPIMNIKKLQKLKIYAQDTMEHNIQQQANQLEIKYQKLYKIRTHLKKNYY